MILIKSQVKCEMNWSYKISYNKLDSHHKINGIFYIRKYDLKTNLFVNLYEFSYEMIALNARLI